MAFFFAGRSHSRMDPRAEFARTSSVNTLYADVKRRWHEALLKAWIIPGDLPAAGPSTRGTRRHNNKVLTEHSESFGDRRCRACCDGEVALLALREGKPPDPQLGSAPAALTAACSAEDESRCAGMEPAGAFPESSVRPAEKGRIANLALCPAVSKLSQVAPGGQRPCLVEPRPVQHPWRVAHTTHTTHQDRPQKLRLKRNTGGERRGEDEREAALRLRDPMLQHVALQAPWRAPDSWGVSPAPAPCGRGVTNWDDRPGTAHHCIIGSRATPRRIATVSDIGSYQTQDFGRAPRS